MRQVGAVIQSNDWKESQKAVRLTEGTLPMVFPAS